jgi:short-subunit dehydrogenase
MPSVNVAGRNVLLTGATGGIGHAIARRLASEGAHLILSGRRAEVLEPLANELSGRALAADLSHAEDLHRLLDQAGEVHILVANAALPATGRLETFTEEELDRALSVNLRAPIVLAHRLVESLRERGEGHMAFVSSLAGKAATPGTTLYNATKFGLRGFALALRAELHSSGVGVSAVFPGFIRDAGMFHDSGTRLPPGVGTRTPEDVAEALLRAIERNKAEVDVAPLSLRAGAIFSGVAPELAAALSRRMGSERLSEDLAAGQRDKR